MPANAGSPERLRLCKRGAEDARRTEARASRIALPPRKPDTVYNGLATALRKHPEFKGIAVVRRSNEVYLRRAK